MPESGERTYTESELQARLALAMAHIPALFGSDKCSCEICNQLRPQYEKALAEHDAALVTTHADVLASGLKAVHKLEADNAALSKDHDAALIALSMHRDALISVVAWEEEYRAINNLGKVPPSTFQRARALLGAKAIADFIQKREAALTQRLETSEARREQAEVQLAGCGVAALGWSKGEQKANPGDYGFSSSYHDVMMLRAKWEEAERQLAELREEMACGHERMYWHEGYLAVSHKGDMPHEPKILAHCRLCAANQTIEAYETEIKESCEREKAQIAAAACEGCAAGWPIQNGIHVRLPQVSGMFIADPNPRCTAPADAQAALAAQIASAEARGRLEEAKWWMNHTDRWRHDPKNKSTPCMGCDLCQRIAQLEKSA